MDYIVDGANWKTFEVDNFNELERDYPGVSEQPQTCAQLGFTQTHISPLYNVQKRTFTDPATGTVVTNAYWEKPASPSYSYFVDWEKPASPPYSYSVAQEPQNWCMDFIVSGPNSKTFDDDNLKELQAEYPPVTKQSQTCAQLGYTQTHISPLYNVQKRTFTDPATGTVVTNAYWEKPSTGMLQQLYFLGSFKDRVNQFKFTQA